MKADAALMIAVVCGGSSAEAEVSRVSGKRVAQALKATFDHVVILELNERIGEELQKLDPDVVFPALHGPPGEDGTFQGFLETMGIPYVGSGVRASMCAMDKIVAKHIFRAAGLPVAKDVIMYRHERVQKGKDTLKMLGSDVVVKPSRQGSALGVAFVKTAKELHDALQQAFQYDDAILIEERIYGKEITVGILERDGVEALPVLEVRTPQGAWYDYRHRYTAGLSEHSIPAPLPEAQYKRVQELAVLAHRALGCRDLSRADFVVPDQGEPILLEVNTLPGMTPTSLYPDIAKAAGITFEALVAHLVERALKRKNN